MHNYLGCAIYSIARVLIGHLESYVIGETDMRLRGCFSNVLELIQLPVKYILQSHVLYAETTKKTT